MTGYLCLSFSPPKDKMLSDYFLWGSRRLISALLPFGLLFIQNTYLSVKDK
jgi:hypothetical protein